VIYVPKKWVSVTPFFLILAIGSPLTIIGYEHWLDYTVACGRGAISCVRVYNFGYLVALVMGAVVLIVGAIGLLRNLFGHKNASSTP